MTQFLVIVILTAGTAVVEVLAQHTLSVALQSSQEMWMNLHTTD